MSDSEFTTSTTQFIASVAARTKTLVMDSGSRSCDEFLVMALETCLQNCTPGTLTQLLVPRFKFCNRPDSYRSIRAETRNPAVEPRHIQDTHILLNISGQRLEEVLLHLTTIQLSGLFFPWASNAYKGLVDLSLTPNLEASGEILVSDLVKVLGSSPGLSRLEIGLTIVGTPPRDTVVEPMVFNKLEVLEVTVKHGAEFGSLLQWISPGPKPLRLSLTRDYFIVFSAPDELFKDNRLAQFFSRSNVPVITTSGLQGISQVSDLLDAAPNAETLVLKYFLSDQNQDYHNFHDSTTSLECLYLLHSEIYVKDLFFLVRAYRIRSVFLWSCEDPKSEKLYGLEYGITSTLRGFLSKYCPALPNVQVSYSKPHGSAEGFPELSRPITILSSKSDLFRHRPRLMIDTLVRTSNALQMALDEYHSACSTIQKSFIIQNTAAILPGELADRIRVEAQLLLKYEAKLQEAKSAISWTRNTSALAPASTLPPDTLTRIFHFALAGQDCSKESEHGSKITYSKYPERLSHVCSRWRQVALSSRELWAHIDLSPFQLLNDGLIPCAKAYAERSGQIPLYIHVHGPTDSRFGTPDDRRAIEFITSVAARTGSLDLDIHYQYASFHGHALEACLKGAVPGVLTRFIVREAGGSGNHCPKLIRAKDVKPTKGERNSGVESLSLDIPKERLEDILLCSVALHLDSVLVPWTKKTYHNLAELRLISSYCRQGGYYIPEPELRNILKRCPQLRILEFGLGINDESGADSDNPIPLKELNTLALDGDVESWEALLRLIAPGPNPLHLSIAWNSEIYDDEIEAYPLADEFTNFFGHSNVAKLTLTGLESSFRVYDILKYATNVRELALDRVYWEEPFEGDVPELDVSVDTLYVLRSSIYVDDLRQLVKGLKIRNLICWGDCRISSTEIFSLSTSNQGVHKKLQKLCPVVKFFDDGTPNPTESWSQI